MRFQPRAPGQTGHFWVMGALAWIFSSSACSQQDEMQSFAPFLCFLCGVWKNETFPGAGAQKAPTSMDGWMVVAVSDSGLPHHGESLSHSSRS